MKSKDYFEPFGVELPPMNSTDNKIKYTGQERDTFTNYDYMHFRFYASSMGRFLQPDNIIPDITNPQNWNAYTYVKGNPVNFNDPSGHGPNVPSYPAYIPNTHSFGMSWFDQFDSGWLPWAGQTAENSWYFGGTRSAFGNYVHVQYKNFNLKSGSGSATVSILTFCGKLLSGSSTNPSDYIGPPSPLAKVILLYFDKSGFVKESLNSFKKILLEMGFEESQIVEQRLFGLSGLVKATLSDNSLNTIVLISHHGSEGFVDYSYPAGPSFLSDSNVATQLGHSGASTIIFWGCYTYSVEEVGVEHKSKWYTTMGKAHSDLTLTPNSALLSWYY